MEKFTIAQFQEFCKLSSYNGADKKIDSLIKAVKNGKLKGEIHRESEMINGSMAKVVYISDDILNKIRPQDDFTESNSIEDVEYEVNVTSPKHLNDSNLNEKLLEEISGIRKELVDKAQLAGQTALLMDTKSNLEKDKEHWQSEYFKLKTEKEVNESKFSETTQLNEQNLNEINKLKSDKSKLIISFSIAFSLAVIVMLWGFSLYFNSLIKQAEIIKTNIKSEEILEEPQGNITNPQKPYKNNKNYKR